MSDENFSFKSGDRVRVKKESLMDQTGKVLNTLTVETGVGFRELVWVKLAGGKVDGFSPGMLEKAGGV